MKTIACIVLLVAAVSAQQSAGPAASTPAASSAATTAASAATTATAKPVNPFGAAFFGPGLNNPIALAPNPALVAQFQSIARTNPNLRVRVDPNGELTPTDQFGREVEIVDQFGNDPFEAFEQQQELLEKRREQEFLLRSQQFQQNLRQQLGLGVDSNLAEELARNAAIQGQSQPQAQGQNQQGAAGAAAAAPVFRIIPN